jgi:hypothetical protein
MRRRSIVPPVSGEASVRRVLGAVLVAFWLGLFALCILVVVTFDRINDKIDKCDDETSGRYLRGPERAAVCDRE